MTFVKFDNKPITKSFNNFMTEFYHTQLGLAYLRACLCGVLGLPDMASTNAFGLYVEEMIAVLGGSLVVRSCMYPRGHVCTVYHRLPENHSGQFEEHWSVSVLI